MKKLLLLTLLTSMLAACDDFPLHDEGWHGRGHWEHGHGHGDRD
jgi:hypothetical protein